MRRYSFSNRRWGRLTVTPLEARDNPAFDAFGAAPGGLPLVQVEGDDGEVVAQFLAFDSSFAGGVRTAVAELDGDDDTVEVIAGAGPGGGPHVKVFQVDTDNGNEVNTLASFFAFEPGFTGGVRVAAGNLGGDDDRDEIVVAADAGGGPRVRTFGLDGSTATTIDGPFGDFFAFEEGFNGGVRVTAGNLNGVADDGDELVLAAGEGGSPRLRVLRTDGAELANFFTFRDDFLGGANVSIDESGAVGRLVVDADADDFTQRSEALNTAAGVFVGPSPVAGVQAGTETGAVGTTTPAGTGPVFVGGGVTGSGLNTGLNGLGTGLTSGVGSSAGFGTTGLGSGGFNTGFGLNPTGFGTGFGPGLSTAGFGFSGATVGSFGTGSAVGFGPFGDPGPVVALPGLSNPVFNGTFTGIGAAGGLSTTGLGTATTLNTLGTNGGVLTPIGG